MTTASAPLPAKRRRGSITRADRQEFLEALSGAWSVTAAAEKAGRSRQRFYELRERDSSFAVAWVDAWERGSDLIRDEIRKRAIDGWSEPVYQKGELVGHRQVKSDRLLETYAKSRMSEYRDTVNVDAHLTVDVSEARDRLDTRTAAIAERRGVFAGREADDDGA